MEGEAVVAEAVAAEAVVAEAVVAEAVAGAERKRATAAVAENIDANADAPAGARANAFIIANVKEHRDLN